MAEYHKLPNTSKNRRKKFASQDTGYERKFTALFCQALYHCKESLFIVEAAAVKQVRNQIFILLQLAISMIMLQGSASYV